MGSRGRKSADERTTLRIVPPAPPRVSRHAPPSHLSPAMQSWWGVVVEGFDMDRHHLHLLEAACGAWDRMVEAREALAEHGLTYLDDRGAPKARPEVAIERDARIAFARLVRELDLDCEAPPEQRPPALRSNRRL
jgi:P27 family predicted phage terminase small subunit